MTCDSVAFSWFLSIVFFSLLIWEKAANGDILVIITSVNAYLTTRIDLKDFVRTFRENRKLGFLTHSLLLSTIKIKSPALYS